MLVLLLKYSYIKYGIETQAAIIVEASSSPSLSFAFILLILLLPRLPFAE